MRRVSLLAALFCRQPVPLPRCDWSVWDGCSMNAGLIKELQDLGYSAKPAPQLGTRQAFDWVADCLLWLCQRCAHL
jgi:hypothetical protein